MRRSLAIAAVLLALWGPVAAAEVAAGRLRVTYVGNEGFLLESSTKRVLMDALYRDGVAGYVILPAERRQKLEAAAPPFDRIDLILASHFHPDHFDAGAVGTHLSANPGAHFLSTPQAVKLLSETAGYSAIKSRVRAVYPGEGERLRAEHNGIVVQVLNLHHGRPSPTENLGFLGEIGGLKICTSATPARRRLTSARTASGRRGSTSRSSPTGSCGRTMTSPGSPPTSGPGSSSRCTSRPPTIRGAISARSADSGNWSTASRRGSRAPSSSARRWRHTSCRDHTEAHPEIRFESNRVEKRGDQLVAIGTFEMRGVSRHMELLFSITGVRKDESENQVLIGIAATTTLNRKEFGVAWKHPEVPLFIGNEVTIHIRLLSKRTPLVQEAAESSDN